MKGHCFPSSTKIFMSVSLLIGKLFQANDTDNGYNDETMSVIHSKNITQFTSLFRLHHYNRVLTILKEMERKKLEKEIHFMNIFIFIPSVLFLGFLYNVLHCYIAFLNVC